MSIATPLVDHVEDLWPAGGRAGGRARRSSSLASNLLGANRAVSNFGGGNTSAKGTAIDHAGREVDGDVGQGLGLRPRDDGRRSTSPACGSTRCCR